MVAVPLMYNCTIKSDVQLQVSFVGADTIGGAMVSSRIDIFCRGGRRHVHGQKWLLISNTPAANTNVFFFIDFIWKTNNAAGAGYFYVDFILKNKTPAAGAGVFFI